VGVFGVDWRSNMGFTVKGCVLGHQQREFAKGRLLFKLPDARISGNLEKWYNYLKGRVKRVIVNYSN
jgi:hypothetical protein